MKYFDMFILAAIAGLWFLCNQQHKTIVENEKIIASLKSDRQRAIDDLEKIKNETKKIIENTKNDKSGFDWDYNYSDTMPIKQLQSKCLSCKG